MDSLDVGKQNVEHGDYYNRLTFVPIYTIIIKRFLLLDKRTHKL